ncbi:MAG: TonB-dependent receptor [Bacteroidales bacterium]|nr:TonB-dependent receptor [Bacteroidales bacterium]
MFIHKNLGRALRFVMMTLVAVAFSVSAWAQNISVSGTVTDVNGDPIIGAYVLVQGTSNGTSTDVDGKYQISVHSNGTLVFTLVGMKDAVVPVNGKAVINVTLEEDSEMLEDVVIVGYGVQKKANLTGAVAAVDVTQTLEAKPMANLGKALQGAVPGLTITTNNGGINSEPTIVVRGIGTLSNSGTSKPLYIVDGVPIDNLTYLNTQDIESISVLKDAASASIYGTRAAFGVVMIKTKTAKNNEKVQVNYTNNFGWRTAINLPSYPTVMEQILPFNDANYRSGLDPELFGMYTNTSEFLSRVEAWQNKHGKPAGYREMVEGDDYFYDKNGIANYVADWDVAGIMFNDATPSQNHTLSISGSTAKTNYYMSVGYNYEQGLLQFNPEKLNKYTATLNVSSQVADWLQVGARVNYSENKYDYPYVRQNTYQYMWRWGSFFGPWGFIRDENGDAYDARQAIGYRKTAGDANTKYHNLRLGAFMKANIVKGLTLNADYTYTFKNTTYKGVGLSPVLWNTWGLTNTIAPSDMGSSTFVETDRSNTNNYVANIYGNYEYKLNDRHNFNLMAGFNVDEQEYEYLYYENHDILDNNMPELALTPTFYSYSHSHTHQGSAGFFARLNYNFADKVLVEINGRYDGSSKFPAHSRWAFFPSASAAYRISQEKFWEPIKDVINNAKIRVSYGIVGNQEVGSNMYLETMSRSANGVNWMGTGSLKYDYFGTPKLVSADLTWEEMKTTNVGLDLGFLKGELNVNLDWFQRETLGMLAPGQTLPNVLGASAPNENAGDLRTRGWEVTVDYNHNFDNGLRLYAVANISDYKTVVTKWETDNPLLNVNYSGKVYGDIYGFETERYFTWDDFNADGSYKQGVASQKGLNQGAFVFGPGDIKFKDQNGDGVIDSGKGTIDDHGDLIVLGNTTPRYQYSLRVGGEWKGFDLDLFFQGVGKRDYWSTSAFVVPFSRGADAIYSGQNSYVTEDEYENKKIDQSKTYPRMFAGNSGQGTISSNIISGGNHNFYPQTKYLLNLAYLRLKTVTLGYSLPENIIGKAKIQKARFYVSIYNALDIINHTKKYGIDPEMMGLNGNAETFGRQEPYARTVSCGLQVTF